ncbi:MAG: hypothetical protein QOG63_3175 [Thermoleophilaceae bacterium]|jgi:hypothetical protein|nr:hypothetical protein [Thermoleophilaceae bacterium]
MRTPSNLIASPAFVVGAAAIAAAFAPSATAAASAAPAVTVAVHPASGPSTSYFTLSSPAGGTATAGTLELDNRRKRRAVVRIDPVAALTASTLGSAYGVAGSAISQQAAWMGLPTRRLVLAPRATVRLPITVAVPRGVAGGDYLSGISVEALGQHHEARMRGNIAVSSIQRYAVGMLVKVPGPRTPLIRITSARIAREPAGLTFYLHARNSGNAILQNVRGRLLITRGRRTVARAPLGPGTFVTGTSIDYPLLVAREQPREGASYRVRAVMRYHGGIARFDNKVRFNHTAAQAQQDFGGRPATDGRSGGISTWLVMASGALVAMFVLVALFLFFRRRRTPGPRAARRAIDAALAAAAAERQPLSLVRIVDSSRETQAGDLAKAVRARMRPADTLYRIGKFELLVILPATNWDAARVVYSDLATDSVGVNAVEAHGRRADVLLVRLRNPEIALDELELSPEMIHRWTSASKDESVS